MAVHDSAATVEMRARRGLSLRRSFAGAIIEVETDSAEVLAHAQASFPDDSGSGPRLRVAVEVDSTLRSAPPWRLPHFRGRDGIVVGTYSDDCVLVLDMHRRVARARVSPAFARDRERWLHSVFPVIVGVMSAPLGITPLHAACVEIGAGALLITGPSGAGKSTLAVALARLGARLLSDDWTYLAPDGQQVWSMGAPVKLMPDCTAFFPELGALEPGIALNGEVGFEVEAERVFGVRPIRRSRAAEIVLLERHEGPRRFAATRIEGGRAAAELTAMLEELPAEFDGARARQQKAVERLVSLPCWRLRCGGSPQEIARALARWWSEKR